MNLLRSRAFTDRHVHVAVPVSLDAFFRPFLQLLRIHENQLTAHVVSNVLPQRAGVRVRFATPVDHAGERFVAHVHVHVFLAIAGIGESSGTTLKLTDEGFLT